MRSQVVAAGPRPGRGKESARRHQGMAPRGEATGIFPGKSREVGCKVQIDDLTGVPRHVFYFTPAASSPSSAF